MFAVQSNCEIFAFQGHYLSTFDKKQYRNTLKINPPNFFIWLINLRWWPSFRNFAIINLRGKDQIPWNHESFCPQTFLKLRSTNYQTRRKIVSRYASINFVCNYYFLYNQKGKVYLRSSKYLILPFVLESGLSITKSPQLPHLTFHGHKNSFFSVPDLIFIWSPLTTLETFFSENLKKMQIEATEVFWNLRFFCNKRVLIFTITYFG